MGAPDTSPMAETQLSKTCFVTVGATASFSALIQSVVSGPFLAALRKQGYTELLIQYGEGGADVYDPLYARLQNETTVETKSLKISAFDLDKAGLGRYMRQAKGNGKNSQEGVVISHAGSGTILDALRMSVPLVVVPNTDLLDNHQVELAQALAEQDYVVQGDKDNLAKALEEAEVLRKKQKSWPPPNAGVQREAKGLKGVLDEEMGFLD